MTDLLPRPAGSRGSRGHLPRPNPARKLRKGPVPRPDRRQDPVQPNVGSAAVHTLAATM